jgi:hypothetical protein
MLTKIERQIDELTREEFYFVDLQECWKLQQYYLYSKKTKRHKPIAIKHYDRIDSRECNIKIEEINLDDEIKELLLDAIVKKFKVEK